MPRLFLGTYLNQNDQLALGQLPQLNSTLDTSWNCRIKWSKQSQLHLTWIFFGNIEENRIDNLAQTISEVINSNRHHLSTAEANSLLTYEELECWFTQAIPRLIALVPTTVNTNLLTFANHIRTQLSKSTAADVRQQSQNSFKPHITLARLTLIDGQKPQLPSIKNKELPITAISGLRNFLPLEHMLDTLSLIESVKQNGSHQYKTIQDFPLIDRNPIVPF